MSSDFIWIIIGLVFGYIIGINKDRDNIPKQLEKCDIDRDNLTQDVVYYKKLTKTLVEENSELRKKLYEYENK